MLDHDEQKQIAFIIDRDIKIPYIRPEVRFATGNPSQTHKQSESVIHVGRLMKMLTDILEQQSYLINVEERRQRAKVRGLERALGLGWGYLSNPATLHLPETVALLKIIESMPWMVEVAEYGFDPEISKLLLQRAAIDIKIKGIYNEKKSKASDQAKEQTTPPPTRSAENT